MGEGSKITAQNTTLDLAALIGSRICHDLISPIGAINNGLELLGMAGGTMGPELSLINDSVGSASARIRFFRLAFGAAGDQDISAQEISSIFREMGAGQKLVTDWQVGAAARRADVRVAFLAQQCLDSSMPYGGNIVINRDAGGGWAIIGHSDKYNVDETLWSILGDGQVQGSVQPANVQFPLLAMHCREEGRALRCSVDADQLAIRF